LLLKCGEKNGTAVHCRCPIVWRASVIATAPRPEDRAAHVGARLAQLGLRPDVLGEAVLHGYHEAATCTENDPRLLPSWLRYGRSTGRLRDRLRRDGWTAYRERGYETTLRADKAVAIVVCSGDAYTGIDERGKRPSARNPKGAMTEKAVLANIGRYTPEIPFDSDASEPLAPPQTWLLLHYFDRSHKEIRLELSLPIGFTRKKRESAFGQIDVWGERLPLAPVSFDIPASASYVGTEEPPDEYEADVTWKETR
jgi:hypothetical protein